MVFLRYMSYIAPPPPLIRHLSRLTFYSGVAANSWEYSSVSAWFQRPPTVKRRLRKVPIMIILGCLQWIAWGVMHTCVTSYLLSHPRILAQYSSRDHMEGRPRYIQGVPKKVYNGTMFALCDLYILLCILYYSRVLYYSTKIYLPVKS